MLSHRRKSQRAKRQPPRSTSARRSIRSKALRYAPKNMPGSIATMAMADGGTLLHAPDVYMDKLAIGPGYAKGVDRHRRLAGRQRHAPRQGQGRRRCRRSPSSCLSVRATPSIDRERSARPARRVRLITRRRRCRRDQLRRSRQHRRRHDISARVGRRKACSPRSRRPRCIDGQMQCRLILDSEEKRERAAQDGRQRSPR